MRVCLSIVLVTVSIGLASCQRSEQLCENSDWTWTSSRSIFDGAVHSLRLHKSGQITVNGKEYDDAELETWLDQRGQMPWSRAVLLRHDKGVPCWEVVEMRALMRKTLKCDEVNACHEGREWDWIPETGLRGGF